MKKLLKESNCCQSETVAIVKLPRVKQLECHSFGQTKRKFMPKIIRLLRLECR